MASVNFTIKGLAAFYRKAGQDFWNVSFPIGGKHQMNFWYYKNGVKIRVGEIGERNINILSNSSKPPANYEEPSFNKYVLDLTGDFFHRDGLRSSILPQGLVKNTLRIPHATVFSASERHDRINFVFPTNNFSQIKFIHEPNFPHNRQIFSNQVGGRIEIPDDKTITIEIDGEEPIHLGKDDSFHIDNDCHSFPPENDFQRYQDLFCNIRDNQIKYQLITLGMSILDFTPASLAKVVFDKGVEAFILDLLIRIMTDPPPLFCDTVRIGKPEDI